MIEAIMRIATDIIFVRVTGNKVEFSDSSRKLATIEGLRLSRSGVVKEFPDLKDDVDWRLKAIERFKEKIQGYGSEEEIITYVMSELKEFGYIPLYKQKAGFRREKVA